MTDQTNAYDVDGVTVTPVGGGYYDLTHSSLSEPERVRGKEAADARAADIAKAPPAPPTGTEDDGSLQQAPIDEADKDAQIAALKAALADANGKVDDLTKAADPIVQTVKATEGPDTSKRVPGALPRRFDAETDAALLKKLGVKTTKIVLEESPDIPPTGLFIGHNGRGYVIVPGEEVVVPDFLLKVLDNAVMASPIVDAKSQKVLGYRSRTKYPYRRV